MPKNDKVPNAWDDDDWEAQADRVEEEEPEPEPEVPAAMTRSERLAKHAEEQRKLWESAYDPSILNACVLRPTADLTYITAKRRRSSIS